MGFIHDVKRIITKLPEKRQTLFFSATMPPEIQKLANVLLTNPAYVEVTPASSTVDAIEQSLFYVDKKDKPIHGNKSQNARQNALSNFKNGNTRVLVATDIAARGIDIDELSHVINFELPNVPETYVHRIGRTGRAGNTGIAFSFCGADERAELKDIQKLIAKNIPVVEQHPFPLSAESFNAPPAPKQQQQQPKRSRGYGNNDRNKKRNFGSSGRNERNYNTQ